MKNRESLILVDLYKASRQREKSNYHVGSYYIFDFVFFRSKHPKWSDEKLRETILNLEKYGYIKIYHNDIVEINMDKTEEYMRWHRIKVFFSETLNVLFEIIN